MLKIKMVETFLYKTLLKAYSSVITMNYSVITLEIRRKVFSYESEECKSGL